MRGDWLLLLVESAVLLLLMVREFRRGLAGNTVGLTLFIGLLVIVAGQQWYTLTMFEGYRTVYIFENRITREGFHLASIWLAASVVLMAFCYVFVSGPHRPLQSSRPMGWPDSIDAWIIAALLASLGFVLLCVVHSGVLIQLAQLGSNTGGVVLALSLVGFAKYPYLHKLAFTRRPARRDLLLLIGACLLMVINSRGFALTVLLQVFLISSYRGRPSTVSLLAKYAVVGLAIVVVYGSLRDFAHWRYSSGAIDFGDVYQADAMREFFVDRHFDFLWLFYEHSVGVFSGFAGILSFYQSYGIRHDLGMSVLVLLPHLTPYGVRTGLFRNLEEWLTAAYPYKGSVVPGGFEASFAHFGFSGVVAYSLALGLVPAVVHKRLLKPDGDLLKWGLLAPYIFTFVMCDISMVAFFVMVELASLGVFRAILETTARKIARTATYEAPERLRSPGTATF